MLTSFFWAITDPQGLIVEVEKMKSEAEHILSSVENQKEIVGVSDELLAKLNPAFKEKRETEQRFEQLEKRMNSVDDNISQLLSLVKSKM